MHLLRKPMLPRLPMLAVVATIGLVAQAASAVPVSFATTFEFDGGGNTVVGTFNSTFTVDGIGSVGTPIVEDTEDPGTVGILDLDIDPEFEVDLAVKGFTLGLEQFLPLPNGSTTVAGNVLTGTVTLGSSAAFFDFDVNSVVIGQIKYTFADQTVASGAQVQGDVSFVPLPAAAWGGMALFGVLGGVKVRRSRQSVA